MPNIRIKVSEKRAVVEGNPVIVCGNSDYTVTFDFDNEWSQVEVKTARFVYAKDGETRHEDVVFSDNTVAVPVLSGVPFVKVGLFAGNLSTTTPARVLCDLSILCGAGAPAEPTPDVYNQIMALLEELERLGQVEQIEQNRLDIAELTEQKAEQTEVEALQTDLGALQTEVEAVEAIAKGRNRARVFATTEAMQTWLSDVANKGAAIKGDNLYIEDLDVPDWWIAEVLEEADADTGYYYRIAQLETQKVDLVPIEEELDRINSKLSSVLYIESFDSSTGTLVTRSADYTG